MKSGEKLEVVLKRGRSRYFPKAINRHTKIKVKEGYTFNVSVWVADTPESNLMPTVNLVMQHNGDKVRLCFKDATDLVAAVEELRHFVGSCSVMVHEKHTKAVEEFLRFHGEHPPPPHNEYTVYTVIHDRLGKKEELLVDQLTGEIIRGSNAGCNADN